MKLALVLSMVCISVSALRTNVYRGSNFMKMSAMSNRIMSNRIMSKVVGAALTFSAMNGGALLYPADVSAGDTFGNQGNTEYLDVDSCDMMRCVYSYRNCLWH